MFGFNKQKRLNRSLASAAQEGNIRDIAQLLDAGADIEMRDDRYWDMTPLGMAAHKGHHPAVRLLLERGANIDAQDKAGDTPLMNSVYDSRREALEELLKRGANRDIQNNKGLTAADIARKRSDAVIRKALGVDPEQPVLPPAPPPPAPEMNPDEVVLKRKLGDKVLEEVFNFSACERISLVRASENGRVEAMTRDSFDAINPKVLRNAFEAYARQGGTIPENEVFPEAIAKIKPQPRNS
ncbi:MAG: ankyrin repeat domain-containing protein [Alphaproteobacteria bacterium]|nr:MAG: ankyrin repeat domain-containing protein [Alphaproteobacteria bacterium]